MNQARCPNCNQIIVSKKFTTCTTCGFELPKELVMTEEQKKSVEQIDHHSSDKFEENMKFIRSMPCQDIRSGYG
jgi:hypothetical protein